MLGCSAEKLSRIDVDMKNPPSFRTRRADVCGSRSFAEKATSRLRGATVSGRDRLARASALLLMQGEKYNDRGECSSGHDDSWDVVVTLSQHGFDGANLPGSKARTGAGVNLSGACPDRIGFVQNVKCTLGGRTHDVAVPPGCERGGYDDAYPPMRSIKFKATVERIVPAR
jgi:hypothetical protein